MLLKISQYQFLNAGIEKFWKSLNLFILFELIFQWPDNFWQSSPLDHRVNLRWPVHYPIIDWRLIQLYLHQF